MLDLDGDGWQDVVACREQCAVVFGPGSATPSVAQLPPTPPIPGTSMSSRPRPAAAGDLDGNGFMDLLVRRITSTSGGADGAEEIVTGRQTVDAVRVATRIESTYRDSNREAPGDLDLDGYADLSTLDRGVGWTFRRGSTDLSMLALPVTVFSTTSFSPDIRLVVPSTSESSPTFLIDVTLSGGFRSLWSMNATSTPAALRQRWSWDEMRSSLPDILEIGTARMFSVGDLDGDQLPEFIVGRTTNSSSNTPEFRLYRTVTGPAEAWRLSEVSSIQPLPRMALVADAIGGFDLDADGRSEFAFVASGYGEFPLTPANQRNFLFVFSGDISRPSTIRALELGAGIRTCADCVAHEVFVPVAGDFNRDGYDDLIAPDIDGSRLMILRGGPRIDELRWEPLVLPTPLPTGANSVIGHLA
ncbi:MAG: VCBS repeat-containing protein [Myxococcales bacterium]|nr:VCBS repeat-containing protein [Myxococcales bacterium]